MVIPIHSETARWPSCMQRNCNGNSHTQQNGEVTIMYAEKLQWEFPYTAKRRGDHHVSRETAMVTMMRKQGIHGW
jgi:hypothetical protein